MLVYYFGNAKIALKMPRLLWIYQFWLDVTMTHLISKDARGHGFLKSCFYFFQ